MGIKIVAIGSKKIQIFFKNWGVSFLIGDNLLFDTFGNTNILAKNMKLMNISSLDLKYIVISHEHWDHTNGLWQILEQNPSVKVFICPGSSQKFKDKMKQFHTDTVEINRLTEIKKNVFSTGEIAGEYTGKPMPEQTLIIKNDNLTIITGCAHPGVIRIIEETKKNLPQPIHLVIGGFHLMNKDERFIELVVRKFRELEVGKVAPTHCTGKNAENIFRKEYKDNFLEVETGKIIEI